MRHLKVFTHLVLLTTIPSSFVHPSNACPIQKVSFEQEPQVVPKPNPHLFSYDELLKILDEIESGEIEKRCTPEDVESIKQFLAYIARQGMIPSDVEYNKILEQDIQELLSDDDDEEESVQFRYAYSFGPNEEYIILPALPGEAIQCRGWLKKNLSKAGKFFKKHKKALIIGTAIAVAATLVVVAVVASSAASAAAAAASAAGGAAASDSDHEGSEDSPPLSGLPNDTPENSSPAPLLKSALDEQLASFKEDILKDHLSSDRSGGALVKESGRALGALFAHESLKNLDHQLPYRPGLSHEIENIDLQSFFAATGTSSEFSHPGIDQKFSTDYSFLYPNHHVDPKALSYQFRGEAALASGYFREAVQDFDKAVELSPQNPHPYLDRGVAQFGLGNFDHALSDYHLFTALIKDKRPTSMAEFSMGFAKGLPQGIYDSGEGIVLFLTDLATHPIHTAEQMWSSLNTLYDIARTEQWEVLAKAVSPEVVQLIEQWDTLPDTVKGELAGYALGKHGTDLITPGAVAKVASNGLKGAKELVAFSKGLQRAEQTLLLESAASLGSGAKVAEAVRSSETMAFLGEELGLSTQEMAQLKQAGKLEGAIDKICETWIAKSPSEAYLAAKNGGKHAPLIAQWSDRSAKEIQKSIKSYQKQIDLHMDKIANPSKHCASWDTMDPRRQDALINRRWPAEIQCYTEQRDILQTILDQMQ